MENKLMLYVNKKLNLIKKDEEKKTFSQTRNIFRL